MIKNIPPLSMKNSFLTRIGSLPDSVYLTGILIFTLLIYMDTYSHGFLLQWDDQWVVINGYTKGGFSVSNLKHIFTDYYNGQYSPVNQIYYTSLYTLFGYHAGMFHLAGLAIHLLNVILVYVLVRTLLITIQCFAADRLTPLFVCLLFAIHPVLVESVAWLSASKVLLYTAFFLLTLILYLKFSVSGNRRHYLLAICTFTISFLAKEQAVILPLVLVLVDYLQFGRRIPRKKILDKIPFFSLSILFGLVTMYSQSANGQGILTDVPQYPVYQRLLFCCYSLFEYMIKCAIPIHLSYVYPFPNPVGEPVPIKFYFYPLLLIILTAGFWKQFQNVWVIFGIGFFVINLLPAIHIIPLSRFTIIADRYVYLSSLGVFFLLVYLLRYVALKFHTSSRLIYSCFFLYAFALATYSYQRNGVWKSIDSLKMEIRQVIRSRGYKLYH